jgi:hypothetical protein
MEIKMKRDRCFFNFASRIGIIAFQFLFLFFLIPSFVSAKPPTPETITYQFEDFEQYMSGVWPGRPEAVGWARAETKNVHSGKRAQAMAWDFTKCPDANMCFANFGFHRELVGRPQAVRAWIYAGPGEKGTQLVLWVNDASGEMYISRLGVDWTGWKQVTIPIATSPGWKSGDCNSRQDPPMTLFGLAVDSGGPKKGRIIIDDMEIITQALPREALLAEVGSELPDNIFWQEEPELLAKVKNFSTHPILGLRFDIKIIDTYYGREVWKGQISVKSMDPKSIDENRVKLQLPYGVHRIEWTLQDTKGVIRKSASEISHMMPKSFKGLSPSERAYLMNDCPFGGVFWQCTARKGSDTGARWIRNWVNWAELEPKPGVYRIDLALKQIKSFQDAGIPSLWFTTLYAQPEFWTTDHTDYAPAYGSLHRNLVSFLKGSVKWYELGNEDNGPSKFLYTEVARNGAAGIRAADPQALVANSGTAFVDLGWLRMQAGRGLFNWLDSLCVHPYTTSESPERWGVFEQAGNMVELADELGGMKHLWTTEFGWPTEIDQKSRADWVPRHFLIGVAGGYEKHGLYAWDGHFGIYHDGIAFPAAVSTHAMAKTLEGYRFAGVLERSKDLWVVVWEKWGEPILIAWSPEGKKTWKVPVGQNKVQVLDLFGNPLVTQIIKGSLTLNLADGPQYVLDAPEALTEDAWSREFRSLQERFAAHLKKTFLKDDKSLAGLAVGEKHSFTSYLNALNRVSSSFKGKPREEISGIQANLLRLLIQQARMGAISEKKFGIVADVGEFLKRADAAMNAAQKNDLDLPGLRWAISEFNTLETERNFAESKPNGKAYAQRLVIAQAILAQFAENFLTGADARQCVALWPYLYSLEKDGTTLCERLEFVPNLPTVVKVRVNNYARNKYDAQLTLQLPEGWKKEPAVRDLKLSPGKNVETSFLVTASAGNSGLHRILAQLNIPGRPVVVVPYDNIEIVPAIKVTQEPLDGLLPETPLVLHLKNLDKKTQSGLVRLLLEGQTEALARAEFSGLASGATRSVTLDLKSGLNDVPVPEYNRWPLIAEFTLVDGRVFRQDFRADFVCAVQAESPPVFDGDLSDWKDATPLHIEKMEYTKGSFGTGWSPEDCSGTTYLKWDKDFLYFAARVKDQTFNQNLRGDAIWSQDSIQLAFAGNKQDSRVEFGLALTPQGPEIFNFSSPGDVPGAKMKVTVSQGQIVYEAAIPWSALPKVGPVKEGLRLGYSVLINDDDAIIPRRFLERFGGISHDKDIKNFGHLVLIGKNTQKMVTTRRADTAPVFTENFEEYKDKSTPDAWEKVSHLPPVPDGEVVVGAGRNKSKALVFRNTVGTKPNTYLVLVREIPNLKPGKSYELHAWVKGKGIPETGGIIGVCGDKYGNEAAVYAVGWKADNQWREITLPFVAPAGEYNIILRNRSKIDYLAIEDIQVKRIR